MTILKCDKCGKNITKEEAMIVDVDAYIVFARTGDRKQYDLCKNCTEIIINWLDGKKWDLV